MATKPTLQPPADLPGSTAPADPSIQPPAPAADQTPPADQQPGAPALKSPEEAADSVRQLTEDVFFKDLFKNTSAEKKKEGDEPEASPSGTPAKPSKPAAPAKKEPAAASPPAEPAEPAAQPNKEPEGRRFSEEDIARIAADATANAVSRMGASQKPADQQDAALNRVEQLNEMAEKLPENDQEDAELYVALALSDPKKWGNLIPGIIEFEKKVKEHVRSWKAAHPGEAYNPDDPEHDDFYKDEPKRPSKRELRTIDREITSQRAAELARRETRAEVQEIREASVTKDVNERISKETERFYATAMETLKQKMGEQPVNEKAAKKIIDNQFGKIKPLLSAIEKVAANPTAFNPQNPVHQEIAQTAHQIEDLLVTLPPQSTLRDGGLRFATHAQYKELDPAMQRRHWVVGIQEVKAFLEDGFKRVIDQEYRDWSNIFEEQHGPSTSSAAPNGSNNGAANGATAAAVNPPVSRQNEPAPSVGSRTNVSGAVPSNPNAEPDPMANFFAGLGSR